MFVRSIAHALPPSVFTQAEVWEILRTSPEGRALSPRAAVLLEKVLLGPGGIETRHFAEPDPARLFPKHAGELNAYFEAEAPELAAKALEKALTKAGLKADELDGLVICTCTGYLCPGLSSHVSERLGLRADAALTDLVGAGCGAAIPALRVAEGMVAAQPEAKVAVVAVEICSAAFYLDNDAAVLISLCLFGDAASAVIVGGTEKSGVIGTFSDFRTLHRPEHREKIRFANEKGYLRNRLDRSVPALAAGAVAELLAAQPPGKLISHAGGRDVLDALATALPDHENAASREILRRVGNCSSPSVLLALEHDLQSAPETGERILSSFGAGFSCHSARFAKPPGAIPV
ncbi:MAG: type III polyketide synthase [Verrucomicrobiales bacterium]